MGKLHANKADQNWLFFFPPVRKAEYSILKAFWPRIIQKIVK